MSIREQVQEIAEAKRQLPYELAGYRLIAEIKKYSFRLVLRYDHERQPSKYVTEHYTNHKAALEGIVNAPRQMLVDA